jgi:hypothetical protein
MVRRLRALSRLMVGAFCLGTSSTAALAQPASSACAVAALNCEQYPTGDATGWKLQDSAEAAFKSGRFRQAICVALVAANDRDPAVAGAAHFTISRSWEQIGCKPEAIVALKKSLSIRPHTGRGWQVACEYCMTISPASCAACADSQPKAQWCSRAVDEAQRRLAMRGDIAAALVRRVDPRGTNAHVVGPPRIYCHIRHEDEVQGDFAVEWMRDGIARQGVATWDFHEDGTSDAHFRDKAGRDAVDAPILNTIARYVVSSIAGNGPCEEAGQQREASGHCCYPGQKWSAAKTACTGLPTQCPEDTRPYNVKCPGADGYCGEGCYEDKYIRAMGR